MAMPPRLTGLALAALTLTAGLISTSPVQAEDMIDFMWGGSAEFGGSRSVVSFDSSYKPGQIIVSFSDRRLYLVTKPGQAITYPVAVPKGEARWQGVTFVSNKRVNPSWTPTPDMVRKNPRLPRWVPGGHPMNPLGIRALYLGSSTYRIHGTDAPWTIGQAVSSGCIRMTNKDVLDLYPRIPVGTRVTVTWQRFTTRPVASGGYSDYDRQSSRSGAYASRQNDDADYAEAEPAPRPSRASRSNQDGSLSSLFASDDAPPARKTAAVARTEKTTPGESGTRTTASAAESVDATVEQEETAALAPAKKKSASSAATATKKKAETSDATPAAHHKTVLDPVKTRASAPADPAPPKAAVQKTGSTDVTTPSATKAAVSSTETLAVNKATEHVQ